MRIFLLLLSLLISCKSLQNKKEVSSLQNVTNAETNLYFGFKRIDKNILFLECVHKENFDSIESLAEVQVKYCAHAFPVFEYGIEPEISNAEFSQLQQEVSNDLQKRKGLLGRLLKRFLSTTAEQEIVSCSFNLNTNQENCRDINSQVEADEYLKIKEYFSAKILKIKLSETSDPSFDPRFLPPYIFDNIFKVILRYYCEDIFAHKKLECVNATNKMVKFLDRKTINIKTKIIYYTFDEQFFEMVKSNELEELLDEINSRISSGSFFYLYDILNDLSPREKIRKLAIVFQDADFRYMYHALALFFEAEKMNVGSKERERYLRVYEKLRNAINNLASINYYDKRPYFSGLEELQLEDPEPTADRPYHFYVPAYVASELSEVYEIDENIAASVAFMFNSIYELIMTSDKMEVQILELANCLDLDLSNKESFNVEISECRKYLDLFKKSLNKDGLHTLFGYFLDFPTAEGANVLNQQLLDDDWEDLYYGYAGSLFGIGKSYCSFSEFRNRFLKNPKEFLRQLSFPNSSSRCIF